MEVKVSRDVFQDKLSSLKLGIKFAHIYLDDLLTISNGYFEEYLQNLAKVLQWSRRVEFKINAKKTPFLSTEISHFGYQLTKQCIKSVQKKAQAILDLQTPTTLKSPRSFLGMIQFYRNIWERKEDIRMG